MNGDRLTVCHVFSGDLWAGAEVVIFNLLAGLRREPGLRIVALALNEGTLTERLREAGVTTHVIPESRHTLPGIVWRAARRLRDESVRIIHSHRYKENVLAWLLARRLGGVDLVTTVHGLPEGPDNRGERVQSAGWRRRLDFAIVRNAFSVAVAVSEEMKRALVARYGFPDARVRVIRNGAALPTPAAPAPRNEVFHIGTVGRLVPIKGLELFVEVAARLCRETPAVRFSILGDGPLRAELAGQAARLGLGDRLQLLAPVADPYPYYRSLDVYLNTSLHEGLPLSVVEAMACGTPVVSAAVGGIPEIVAEGEHGFLVDGREPEAFAERCRALMRDEPRRAAMRARASTAARTRSSAAAMAEAYRRLYEDCAARRRPRPAERRLAALARTPVTRRAP